MQKIHVKRTWKRNYSFINKIVANLTTHNFDMWNPDKYYHLSKLLIKLELVIQPLKNESPQNGKKRRK